MSAYIRITDGALLVTPCVNDLLRYIRGQ